MDGKAGPTFQEAVKLYSKIRELEEEKFFYRQRLENLTLSEVPSSGSGELAGHSSGHKMLACPGPFPENDLLDALTLLGEDIRDNSGIRMVIENRGIAKYPEKPVQIFLYRMIRDILLLLAGNAGIGLLRVALYCDGDHLKTELEGDGDGLDVARIYEQTELRYSESGREEKLCEIRECIRKAGGFFHASSHDKNRIMIVMPV